MNAPLLVSVSPHIHSTNSTRRIMFDVLAALAPAMIASVIIFGFRSFLLTLVSVTGCVFMEWLWNVLMKQEQTVGDLSACVTGVLLAFNVPVGMHIWQLLVGDFIAIIIVKMLFGGLGCNFVNPALAARVCMMFSFSSEMTDYAPHVADIDALSSATPLSVMSSLDASALRTLLLGTYGGVLGETCTIALLAGGIYLLARKVIKIWIPLFYILSVLCFTLLFGGPNPLLSIFAGSLFLGAFYMATDYVTSPITAKGQIIFAIGCGFITVMIRLYAAPTEGVAFSILLMNLLVPYINDLTRTKPLGGITHEQ